jgi:hypothetical protein
LLSCLLLFTMINEHPGVQKQFAVQRRDHGMTAMIRSVRNFGYIPFGMYLHAMKSASPAIKRHHPPREWFFWYFDKTASM